jgi:hypothetical protein
MKSLFLALVILLHIKLSVTYPRVRFPASFRGMFSEKGIHVVHL